jgi:hypothetical protein
MLLKGRVSSRAEMVLASGVGGRPGISASLLIRDEVINTGEPTQEEGLGATTSEIACL